MVWNRKYLNIPYLTMFCVCVGFVMIFYQEFSLLIAFPSLPTLLFPISANQNTRYLDFMLLTPL